MSQNDGRNLDLLVQDHEQMNELYQRYLLAIVDRQLLHAEHLLDKFAAALNDHLSYEEEVWVPLFDQHFGKTRGFGAGLILDEHRILEKLLGALRYLVHSMAIHCNGLTGQQVLTLLEESFRFRGVLSHHQARENNVMIPALREIVPADSEKAERSA